jgi:hypothetical protein
VQDSTRKSKCSGQQRSEDTKDRNQHEQKGQLTLGSWSERKYLNIIKIKPLERLDRVPFS